MPILDREVLTCDHPKCDAHQVVANHPAEYAGWTVMNIQEYGDDGISLNNKIVQLAYCPEHQGYVWSKLNIEVGG